MIYILQYYGEDFLFHTEELREKFLLSWVTLDNVLKEVYESEKTNIDYNQWVLENVKNNRIKHIKFSLTTTYDYPTTFTA